MLCGAIPQLLNLQGRLTDKQGIPLTGQYQVKFSLWTSAVGGKVRWSEIQSVNCEKGIFSCLLGSVNPIPKEVFTENGDNYLEIDIEAPVNEPPMTPRQRLVSVAYAYLAEESKESQHAKTADNATIATTAQRAVVAESVNDNSVSTSKIQDKAVTFPKLAEDVTSKFIAISTASGTSGQLVLPGSSPVISAQAANGKITLGNDTKVEGGLKARRLEIGNSTVYIGTSVFSGEGIGISGGQGSLYTTDISTLVINAGYGGKLLLNPASKGKIEIGSLSDGSESGTPIIDLISEFISLRPPSSIAVKMSCLNDLYINTYGGYYNGLFLNYSDQYVKKDVFLATPVSTVTVMGNLTLKGPVRDTNNNRRIDIGSTTIIYATTTIQGNLNITGKISGDGSGLTKLPEISNAETLDGLDSTQFLRSDAGKVIYSSHIVDGSITPEKMTDQKYNILVSTANYALFSTTAVWANNLSGYDANYFINTSSITQTKSGNLNILGNIGVGTMAPDAVLHLYHPDGVNLKGLHIQGPSSSTDKPLVIDYSNGQNILTINGYGNVGIGTTNPTADLDVNGTIRGNRYIRLDAYPGYGSGNGSFYFDGNRGTFNFNNGIRVVQGDVYVNGNLDVNVGKTNIIYVSDPRPVGIDGDGLVSKNMDLNENDRRPGYSNAVVIVQGVRGEGERWEKALKQWSISNVKYDSPSGKVTATITKDTSTGYQYVTIWYVIFYYR